MFENTRRKSPDELKMILRARAREEGIDLSDEKNRYTIWSENGIWSEGASHILLEGRAQDAFEKEREARNSAERSGYSRTFILDAVQDRVEILAPRGTGAVFGAPK